MAWAYAQHRQWREECKRNHVLAQSNRGRRPIQVPDDIVRHTSDPSPCFRCGEREGCKHRGAFGW